MRFFGSLLTGLAGLCWVHGGFVAIVEREDVALGEMALGPVLLLIAWMVLGRAYRGAPDQSWRRRFGVGLSIIALGSVGLTLLAAETIGYPAGRRIAMSIMGFGVVLHGVLAALSFRAASRPPPAT